MVLESLIPALEAELEGKPLPAHVKSVSANGISQVKLIDAAPIGINIRSTVATYANVHDELRKVYARCRDAREKGYKAGDLIRLACTTCGGNGGGKPTMASGGGKDSSQLNAALQAVKTLLRI